MHSGLILKIEQMTLEQKIGQLIVGQAEGKEMSEGFRDFIKKYPIGGFRISGANIESKEQVRRFTDSIKRMYMDSDIAIFPLLASDQEGGTLSVFGKLVTEFPGNMNLGAAGESRLSFMQGNVSGYELSQFGIHMAFAPVADINLQVNNPVIGVRSFGDDPIQVSRLSRAYSEGLNSGGVAGCAKHFPGHGNTCVDSHKELPVNSADFKTFSDTELIPFTSLAIAGVDSCMVSHVLYPNITGNDTPASLSGEIIQGLLRNRLNYDGVVMTDDLEMKAITSRYSISEAVRRFILAGGDIALINGTRDAVIEAFESLVLAVRQGIISMDRIHESLMRVLNLKYNISTYLSKRKLLADNPAILSEEISQKSVTKVRDANEILPLKAGSRILLICPEQVNLTEADTTGGMENRLFDYVKQKSPETILYRTVLGEKSDVDKLEQMAKVCDVVIQCTINCNRFPEQIEIMNKIVDIKPVVAIMLRDPYDAQLIPKAAAVVAAYSAIDSHMEVVSKLIFGDYDFKGRLPVKI